MSDAMLKIVELDALYSECAGDPRDVGALRNQVGFLEQMIELCPLVTGAEARYAQGDLLKNLRARREQLAKRIARLEG